MSEEIRDLLKKHDNGRVKKHLEDLIKTQEFRKHDPEVNDWNKTDVEEIEKTITYTLAEEAENDNQASVVLEEGIKSWEELAEGVDYGDDPEQQEDDDEEDTDDEAFNERQDNKENFVPMSEDFNDVVKREPNPSSEKKKKVTSSKKKDIGNDPNQSKLSSFFVKKA